MTREQIEDRMIWLQDMYWSCISRGIAYPDTYEDEYHELVDMLSDLDEETE